MTVYDGNCSVGPTVVTLAYDKHFAPYQGRRKNHDWQRYEKHV